MPYTSSEKMETRGLAQISQGHSDTFFIWTAEACPSGVLSSKELWLRQSSGIVVRPPGAMLAWEAGVSVT